MPVTHRFTFREADFGTLVFGAESVSNWDNIKPSLIRNDTFRGIMSEYTNTFEFIGVARRRVRDIEERFGIDAELFLQIEIGNESGHSSSFRKLGSELKANFSKTYTIDETTCKLSFSPTGFQENIISRADLNVNHNTTTSIDGFDFGGNIDTSKDVFYHVREIVEQGNYIEGINYASIFTLSANFIVPALNVVAKDGEEMQSTLSVAGDFPTAGFAQIEALGEASFFRKSISARTITLKIAGTFVLQSAGSPINRSLSLGIIHLDAADKVILDGGLARVTTIKDFDPWLSSLSQYNAYVDETVSMNIDPGTSLFLTFFISNAISGGGVTTSILGSDATMTVDTVIIDSPTQAKGILVHEAFERNLQVITGQSTPFISNVFGRTELGYTSDGAEAYNINANGKMVRNFPPELCPLNTNLKDLFTGYNSVYNIVGFIENNKFRIEKYADVFELENSIFIDDPKKIMIELDDKMHYLKVITGYKDNEFEEVNGLNAFNSKLEFAVPLKSATQTLNNECKFRTDESIEFARRLKYDAAKTLDSRYDKDLFLIRGVLAGDIIGCEKDEDFDIVTGIYSPSTAYNLNITPVRNLFRWGSVIASGLNKKTSGLLKFVKAEKNFNLTTKLISETEAILEGADIDIVKLARPIELPYKITFDAVISIDDWNTLIEYPNRTIGINVKNEEKLIPLFGWIETAEFNMNTGEISFTLIRANR